jgi:L-cysteine/cystine lyase
MIVTSHLTWNTGTVLPIAEIQALAIKHDLLLVCDAAQSAGSIATDLGDLQIDVYATPGQKWFCGPEGTGATIVSDRALERLSQTVVGGASFKYGSVEHVGGYFLPQPGTSRFEVAGSNQPAIVGYATSVNWIAQDLGIGWVSQRIAELGHYAHGLLSGVEGVTVITPKDRMAGLVSFRVEGVDPAALVAQLAEDRVVVGRWNSRAVAPLCRELSRPPGIRVPVRVGSLEPPDG